MPYINTRLYSIHQKIDDYINTMWSPSGQSIIRSKMNFAVIVVLALIAAVGAVSVLPCGKSFKIDSSLATALILTFNL